MFIHTGHIPAPEIHPEKAYFQTLVASRRKWSARRRRLRIQAWLFGRPKKRPLSSSLPKYLGGPFIVRHWFKPNGRRGLAPQR